MTPHARTRILYVSPPQPYQSIRSLHVARALQQVGDVKTVIVDALSTGIAKSDVLGTEFMRVDELPVQTRDTGLLQRLRRAFDPRCPLPHSIGADDDSEDRLIHNMGRFDLVWVFKLRTANMFRLWRWPNSVLDVDDLPSGVYASLATGSRFVRERLNAKIQVHRWRRREQLLGERFSVLTVCSDADRRKLDVPVPVYVVPNGFSPANHALERRPATPPRLGFIGLFDHEPNVEGVQWFIRDCWPRITQALPDARLRLAGRFGDSIFGRSSPNIDALGWVEDADREISSWSLMVVPLRVGGGTRVKIAEGFSRKCPIVTTSVGAYGYDVDASDLIVTDDAVAFAEACVSLIRDPSRGRALAERAYAKYLHKWTWDAIAPTIWQAAEDCLSRRQVSPAGTAPSGRRAAIQ